MGEEKRRRASVAAAEPVFGKCKSVRDLWVQWFERIMAPMNPGAVQIRETKRAFYAGIQGYLYMSAYRLEDTGNDMDVTDADIRWMQSIEKELSDFATNVKEGRE